MSHRRFFTALDTAFKAGCTIRRAENLAASLLKSSAHLPTEYIFTPDHFNRARQYVRFFSLLEKGISLLHNYPAEKKENEAFVFLSACGPLFDDLFDRRLAGSEDIIRVTRSLQTNPGDDPLLLQYAVFLANILKRIVNKDAFLHTAEQLCIAQEGAARLNNSENQETLLHYTRLKGGYTALLCRCIADIPFVEYEQELFMQIGFISQITDDLFDYPADFEQGHLTSVLSCKNLNEVRQLYERNRNHLDELLQQLPLPERQKKLFQSWLILPHAVFYIGYDHFLKMGDRGLLMASNGRRIPACDMESRKKQWDLLMKMALPDF